MTEISRLVLLFVLCFSTSGLQADEPNVLQEFTIHEHFGVSHVEQLIDFDLKATLKSGNVHVIGPDGEAVPFQISNGGTKVAVMASLPAGESRTWKLVAGPSLTKFKAAVDVARTTSGKLGVYSITNGITGVKVPAAVRGPALEYVPPWSKAPEPAEIVDFPLPAPIQDVLMRDRKWATPAVSPSMSVKASRFVRSETKVLERGPLRATVEVAYYFQTAKYTYGQTLARPEGDGFYRCTVRIEAGRPSVLVMEESDLDVAWTIDLYRGVKPNQMRYWGHSCSDKAFGQEEDGSIYKNQNDAPEHDAILPINFDRLRLPGYLTNEDTFRTVSAWDPWVRNGGHYWQMFDKDGADDSNLVGIFSAKTGLAIEVGYNGPGFWLSPPYTPPGKKQTPQPLCGIGSNNHRRMPDNSVFPKTRFAWGLFVGAKADVKPPYELQPINHEMNVVGGFNLNKVHRYHVDFPDPAEGYGGMFMERATVESIRQRIRDDKEGPYGKGYYSYLFNADPYTRPMFAMWSEPGRELFDKQVETTLNAARDILNELVNGRGIFGYNVNYWMGGLRMAQQLVYFDQLLSDPRCTPEQRTKLKAAAVMFGSVMCDNDFVPLDNWKGFNLGTANMPVQMGAMRQSYALFLASHPTFAQRAKNVIDEAPTRLDSVLDEHGIAQQSPHYTNASVNPTVLMLAMVQQRGGNPLQGNDRASKFGDFYMNLLTPPETRFKGTLFEGARTPVVLGDGGLDPTALYGLYGTLIRKADPQMSARMMGAWDQSKRPHTAFYASSTFMIDDTLKMQDPQLGDYNGPNYYSVLRHGWGKPHESAMFFVTGDRYFDHRHADHGNVVLYALGQAIVTDWSSMYQPHVGGSFMHNNVTLERSLTELWDKDGVNQLEASTVWTSKPQTYASFPESAFSTSRYRTEWTEATTGSDSSSQATTPQKHETNWTRTVIALRQDPERPVYVVRDTCDSSDLKRIATFNMVAQGETRTPDGTYTSSLDRYHPVGQPTPSSDQLPFVGAARVLSDGVNRYSFTGPHGIDCDVLVITKSAEASLGHWTVEYQTATVQDATERKQHQQILRIRTAEPLTTILIPRRSNDTSARATVEHQGEDVVIRIEDTSYIVQSGRYSVLHRGNTHARNL